MLECGDKAGKVSWCILRGMSWSFAPYSFKRLPPVDPGINGDPVIQAGESKAGRCNASYVTCLWVIG